MQQGVRRPVAEPSPARLAARRWLARALPVSASRTVAHAATHPRRPQEPREVVSQRVSFDDDGYSHGPDAARRSAVATPALWRRGNWGRPRGRPRRRPRRRPDPCTRLTARACRPLPPVLRAGRRRDTTTMTTMTTTTTANRRRRSRASRPDACQPTQSPRRAARPALLRRVAPLTRTSGRRAVASRARSCPRRRGAWRAR